MHPRWRPTVVTMLTVAKIAIGAGLIVGGYVLGFVLWPDLSDWLATAFP